MPRMTDDLDGFFFRIDSALPITIFNRFQISFLHKIHINTQISIKPILANPATLQNKLKPSAYAVTKAIPIKRQTSVSLHAYPVTLCNNIKKPKPMMPTVNVI